MGRHGKYPHNALTQVKINSLKPGFHADGNCLYLAVENSGTKHWIVRTTVNGKRRDIGIGGLKYVSLADAREKAIEVRKVARTGGDPLAERQQKRQEEEQKAAELQRPTFEAAARLVHADREKTFRNALHRKHWIDSLDTYAFPIIGKTRVDLVTTADLLKVLNPVWLRIPDTARRVKQRMQIVLDWAKAAGHRTGDNPADGIQEVLPKHQNGQEKHYAALPYTEIPAFIQSLRSSDAAVSGRLAFEFLVLTAARTGEVIKATWKEIDLEEKLWKRPAAHMKGHRDHTVPLTPRCVEILREAKKLSDGSPYIFPGMRSGQHLSNMVFIATLKRMDKTDITPHGMRSAFRDWAEEKATSHTRRTIEECLAHRIKDKVEGAYNRTQLLEKRADLMAQWERFATSKPIVKIVKMRG